MNHYLLTCPDEVLARYLKAMNEGTTPPPLHTPRPSRAVQSGTPSAPAREVQTPAAPATSEHAGAAGTDRPAPGAGLRPGAGLSTSGGAS